MRVGHTQSLPCALAGQRPVAADSRPEQEPKQEKDSLGERVSRGAGYGLHALGKIPGFYRYVPGLLRFAMVDGLIATLELTAGLTGLAGMAGLSAAGVFEVARGVHQRDPVQVLGGSGEVARGLFIGGVASAELLGLSPQESLLVAGARGAGLAHGVLNLASGLLKLRRGLARGDRDDRVEGLLEMGMAACAFLATGAWSGLPLGAVLGVHGLLAASKLVYSNRALLARVARKVRGRSLELGRRFRDIFRDESMGLASLDQAEAVLSKWTTVRPSSRVCREDSSVNRTLHRKPPSSVGPELRT